MACEDYFIVRHFIERHRERCPLHFIGIVVIMAILVSVISTMGFAVINNSAVGVVVYMRTK